MDSIKEFMASFTCEPPEYLPQILKARLSFLSCLSHKESREVYLTEYAETGGKAILKITQPHSPDSVKREYELLGKLAHPSIPKALFYHQDGTGREYLIREYMPGDTLDLLLERDDVFDARATLEILKKLCGVLAYLHRQSPSIIYRDIKPQNIIMTPNGKVSLIDFGISREDCQEKNYDTTIVGSTAFAAPEMYGFTKSDSRTDIFMLGRLALYLNTGNYNQQEAIDRVESKELKQIIKKCTELSPEKRYTSVEKLSRAIDRSLYPPTRKEMAISVLAAALCLIVGLFGWVQWNKSVQNPLQVPFVSAGGAGYEHEVKIPVLIRTLWNGEPFSDCAVSVDNHYWYEPAQDGRAELYAFAYDEYKIRAVMGNRTADALSAVTQDTKPLSFTFDLANTPEAPEYIPLSLPFGQTHESPLDIANADSVTFADKPDWAAVEKRNGGFYLLVSGGAQAPGHYYLFAEAANESGKAEIALSLSLIEKKPVTIIYTAQELDNIRHDLSGHFALGADIDLGDYESWTPIGTGETPFTGVFDGMGHSISGFCIQGKQSLELADSGLFGVMSHGVIRNVVIRGGNLYTAFSSGSGGHGFLVGRNIGGLIEDCAVFDSKLSADIGLESGAGGICGVNQGVVRNCFNAADISIITASGKSWTESCAGGVCGTNNGYLSDCGNIGNVTGISIAGGVAGFNDMGILTRCYNAGYVKAPAYFRTHVAGGVCHMLGRGKIISYCAFEKGTAQVGASVFNGGTLLGITPVDRETFRDLGALSGIFHMVADGLVFASLDSYYPIPAGIFTERAEPPVLSQSGLSVNISPAPSVKYFYTTDGTDPNLTLPEGVDSVSVTLKAGDTIRVFAAKPGCMDSETVEYKVIPIP